MLALSLSSLSLALLLPPRSVDRPKLDAALDALFADETEMDLSARLNTRAAIVLVDGQVVAERWAGCKAISLGVVSTR